MPIDVNNPYVRTKVLTASREELRLMLIEGCIDFLRTGRKAMLDKDWEKVYKCFTDAKSIILELMGGLKHDIAPELCTNLQGLYTYLIATITEGSFQKSTAKIDEALKLMEYERETWLLLMEKLNEEKGVQVNPSLPFPGNQKPSAHDASPRVGGSLSVEG